MGLLNGIWLNFVNLTALARGWFAPPVPVSSGIPTNEIDGHSSHPDTRRLYSMKYTAIWAGRLFSVVIVVRPLVYRKITLSITIHGQSEILLSPLIFLWSRVKIYIELGGASSKHFYQAVSSQRWAHGWKFSRIINPCAGFWLISSARHHSMVWCNYQTKL